MLVETFDAPAAPACSLGSNKVLLSIIQFNLSLRLAVLGHSLPTLDIVGRKEQRAKRRAQLYQDARRDQLSLPPYLARPPVSHEPC